MCGLDALRQPSPAAAKTNVLRLAPDSDASAQVAAPSRRHLMQALATEVIPYFGKYILNPVQVARQSSPVNQTPMGGNECSCP
jgi:hypothetical protein